MSNHQAFLRHLDESQSAVWCVAQWLTGLGYEVCIRPTTKAATQADWQDHADDGDLHVLSRLEVKHLGVNFTCREDWPFGSNFIVCGRNSFDRADPKPLAYVILSQDKQYAAVVKSDSSPRWKVKTKIDSRYKSVAQEFYFAPLDDVTFFRFADDDTN